MGKKFEELVESMWCTESGHALWRVKLTAYGAAHPELLPSVDLSRTKHGRCIFRLDKVQEHDGHAPSAFKSTADRDAYVKRVVTDAKAALAGVGDVLCGYKKVG